MNKAAPVLTPNQINTLIASLEKDYLKAKANPPPGKTISETGISITLTWYGFGSTTYNLAQLKVMKGES